MEWKVSDDLYSMSKIFMFKEGNYIWKKVVTQEQIESHGRVNIINMLSNEFSNAFARSAQQQIGQLASSSMASAAQIQAIYAQQLQADSYQRLLMGTSPLAHFGEVKRFRKEFKEYSKEDFRKISKDAVVKDILSGMTKLNQEEIKNRIKEHLETIK